MVEVNNIAVIYASSICLGLHAGTSSQIDLYHSRVNGNITLNTSDHDVHFDRHGVV